MSDDPILQQRFAQFTPEKTLTPGYGDSYLFFVGRDDVHGILLSLLSNEKLSLKMNMFGYDDQQLNDAILALFTNPNCHVQVSLDRSQAGGVAEKKIIAADQQNDATEFANSFVILESATHQISHTKGGVLASQGLYFEGSTNWSSGGEGTGIQLVPGVHSIPGFKAQNNTLLVSSNPTAMRRFSVQLDVEHNIGLQQVTKANKESSS